MARRDGGRWSGGGGGRQGGGEEAGGEEPGLRYAGDRLSLGHVRSPEYVRTLGHLRASLSRSHESSRPPRPGSLDRDGSVWRYAGRAPNVVCRPARYRVRSRASALARRESPGTGPGLGLDPAAQRRCAQPLDVVAERQVLGGRDRDRAEPARRGALRGARLPPALPLGPPRGLDRPPGAAPGGPGAGAAGGDRAGGGGAAGRRRAHLRPAPAGCGLPLPGHRWHRAPLGRDAPLAVVPPG